MPTVYTVECCMRSTGLLQGDWERELDSVGGHIDYYCSVVGGK